MISTLSRTTTNTSPSSSSPSSIDESSLNTSQSIPCKTTPPQLLFYVNGQRVQLLLNHQHVFKSLAEYLRHDCQLSGTKIGCNEGGCGSCIVMLSRYDTIQKKVLNYAVNACLYPLVHLDGCSIITIEAGHSINANNTNGNSGNGCGQYLKEDSILSLLKSRVVEFNALQCGFCTPGIIMSLYALMRNCAKPTMKQIELCLDGNLCRCTGYRSIMDMAMSINDDESFHAIDHQGMTDNSGGCGNCDREGGCCKSKNTNTSNVSNTSHVSDNNDTSCNYPKEYLFPFELRNYQYNGWTYQANDIEWYRPTCLQDLTQILLNLHEQEKNPKFIVGNSEVSLEMRHRDHDYSRFISLTHINEMLPLHLDSQSNELVIGSSITIQYLMEYLTHYVNTSVDSQHCYKFRKINTILEQCKWFASTAVRNVASIGGNIMTGSPISDLVPIWQALNAQLTFLNVKTNEKRIISIRDIYTGYRKLNIIPNLEVLLYMTIPNIETTMYEYCKAFKQSRRREDGIAIVNGCMTMKLDESNMIIDSSISFGGMSFKVIHLFSLCEFLCGKNFTDCNLFQQTLELLNEQLQLQENVPGGQSQYRMTLAQSFLLKFWTHIKKQLQIQTPKEESILSEEYYLPKEEFQFSQYIENDKLKPKIIDLSLAKNSSSVIGKNHVDIYGKGCVEGQVQYLDDIPPIHDELQAYPIFTTHAHAKIIKVDASIALKMEGVHHFVSASDVPNNRIGSIIPDEEEVFKSEESTSVGQLIGLILADTQHQAREASKKIIVHYEPYYNKENTNMDDTKKPILSIDQAIERKSFYENQSKHLQTSSLSYCEYIEQLRERNEMDKYEIIEGYTYTSGQEHFYLETQSCLVIPQSMNFMDKSGWTIMASTQSVAATQQLVSSALNIPMNQVQVKTPQKVGGGFGGKESRAAFLASACAIGALKSGKPVRLVLDRVCDMKWSGTRNPFKGEFKCCINRESLKIESAQINLYCNAGYSLDLSGAILEKSILTVDNCYSIEHLELNGRCCKTNLPSNTAFRGFGGPQGMFIMETMIEHVADHLSKNSNIHTINSNIDGSLSMKIRRANMYNINQFTTPCGQTIPDVDRIESLFNQNIELSKYNEKLKEINEFNKINKYRKRGLSIIPSKFGVGFQELFMNQGCTQINIYAPDGSVLINTGGVEMGQGLYTKIVMVVSNRLGIPTELINISSSNSNIIPNPIATCGSMGTDLFAGAALEACNLLIERLKPIRKLLNYNGDNSDTSLNDNNRKLTKEEWSKLINTAYFSRVCLSAIGFIKPPSFFKEQTWNESTLKGNPQLYYVCGVCTSQVEIDVLTGDWIIQSIDLTMDIGDTINPAIDIGQIEGALTQGIGLFMMEELVWGNSNQLGNTNNGNITNNSGMNTSWLKDGTFFSIGPANYKIPSFNDLSSRLNIHLLKKENSQAYSSVYRSKAVGEPPLQLGCSVLFAIRNAIKSFRIQDENINEIFTLDAPATCQRIRLLCHDQLVTNIIKNSNTNILLSSNDQDDNNNEGKIIRVLGNY